MQPVSMPAPLEMRRGVGAARKRGHDVSCPYKGEKQSPRFALNDKLAGLFGSENGYEEGPLYCSERASIGEMLAAR